MLLPPSLGIQEPTVQTGNCSSIKQNRRFWPIQTHYYCVLWGGGSGPNLHASVALALRLNDNDGVYWMTLAMFSDMLVLTL